MIQGMWKVISTAQHDRWMACLEKVGRHDVYHLPGYHRAHEIGTKARAHAYIAEIGGELLFHPVMLRPIERVGAAPAPAGLHDTETVYGYTGPLASTDAPAFLAEAWRGYGEWCAEQGVVCEFTRFNPLLENQGLAAPECGTWLDRQTVAIDLGAGEGALWRGYAGAHRNSIRKAMKNGLICGQRPARAAMPAFRAIYEGTLRGLGADPAYYFSEDHYSRLNQGLGAQLRLFLVSADGTDIAGALFLVQGDTLHYHLAGSAASYRHLAPNNLLIHEVARWAIAQGLETFHLGGGRGPEAADSLFRFKARFSPGRKEMWFGKRVFDQAAYDGLASLWLEQAGSQARPGYFQLYRLDPKGSGGAGRHAAA